MKSALLLIVPILFSCAHQMKTKPIPPFEAQKVCSPQSFAYLQKATDQPVTTKAKEWEEQMLKLTPLIQKCYQADLERTPNLQGFNVCLIADFDAKGNQKFFEFSSQEAKMSAELTSCLNNLKDNMLLKDTRDITVVQPVKLHLKD